VINEAVDRQGPAYRATQGAAVTMTPDGAIKAIVGGRDYELSQFNRATDALRQPGSSFKPFVYLTALIHGYTPKTIVVDGPVWVGNWSPKNYTEKYAGRVSTALANSYNSVPVKLSLETGRKAIMDTTHAVGIQAELETWPPMVLGTSAMTLLDLTTGYATFASGGLVAKPYTVLEIHRPNGDVLYSRANNPEPRVRGVDEEKITELNSMLNAVVTRGTGRRAFLGFTPQGGKTGTTQSYRDAWFIGFTAHNVTGVWFGNDDFSEMKELTGGLLPAVTWKGIMLEAEQTGVAAELPGIPVDQSYARQAAQMRPELRLDAPGTAVANAQPARTASKSVVVAHALVRTRPHQQRLASVSVDEAVSIRRRETRRSTFGVFRGAFGFTSDGERSAKKKRRKTGTVLLGRRSSEASTQFERLRTRER
jgi:penicillin-binding protein 1A